MKRNDELFDAFINEKRAEGRASTTLLNYNKQLRYFGDYLKRKSVKNLTRDEAKEYRNYLSESGRIPSSVNTGLRIVKSFYNFLVNEGHMKSNPFNGIGSIEEGRREVIALQEGEAQDLLSVIDNKRDMVLVKLLLTTGMRAIEVRNLKVEQLGEDVTIIGKGNKQRTIPVQEQVLEDTLDYISSRGINSEYVFCGPSGDRLGESTIRTIIKKYVRKAGLSDKISTHKLRATFATTLYSENVDVLMMKDLLGHESLETTNRYTKINREQKRDAVKNISFY